jgi:hypothetical protein
MNPLKYLPILSKKSNSKKIPSESGMKYTDMSSILYPMVESNPYSKKSPVLPTKINKCTQ